LLNKVTQFFVYENIAERTRLRQKLSNDSEWQEYIGKLQPFVMHQDSTLFLELTAIRDAAGLLPFSAFMPKTAAQKSPSACYEMRTYQLILGYNPVPLLSNAFASGIPAKIKSADYGQLVGCAASEIGDLNKVIELWRFDDADACLRHRAASRGVSEWKVCIGSIAPTVQSFNTSLLKPLEGSRWQ
jgi:hypothetical protein